MKRILMVAGAATVLIFAGCAEDFSLPPSSESETSSDCDPNYSGCVPVYPPDVNCDEVDGPVQVTGDDVHGLDRDGDGSACENGGGGGGGSGGSGGSPSGGSCLPSSACPGKRDGDGDGCYCE